MIFLKQRSGQSMFEIIIAMAIFSLISSAMITMSLGGFTGLEQGAERTQAESLAQEGIEAVKSIRAGAWNEIIYNQSSVSTSSNQWIFDGEGSTEIIGQFTRDIVFVDICRDVVHEIVSCPGTYIDIHTKKIIVTIDWEIRPGVNNSVHREAYLTNWDSQNWIQTDWSGGSGQNIWSNITEYDTDNNIDYSTGGEIKLASISGEGCGMKTWLFTAPTNYTYNIDNIDVISGQAQLKSSSSGTNTFRIKEYYLSPGTFSGTSYNLILDQDLSNNYYVIVSGSDGDGSSNNNRGPDEDYIILLADPFGTGDLNSSGVNSMLSFERANAVDSWSGVITVVECLANCDVSGFQLRDAQRVNHANGSASGTDSSIAWTDINQIMLLGGFNGPGCFTTDVSSGDHDLCHVKIWPSGTNTINWERDKTNNSADSMVMVLEWGSEWNIQRVSVTGTAGGNGANATGEYNTAVINSVVRNNTWVWGTGYTVDNGIGDAAEGSLITLGDGVNQNTSESSVAIGQEYNDNKNFEVYALTHLNLAVDYKFKADGDSAEITVDVVTDTITDTDARMSLVYNGCNGTGTAYPRPILSARYLDDNTIRLERRRSGQNFPAWVEAMDFSGFNATMSYPTNEPPINPIAVYSASGVDTWTSFSEIATKDGGEVYYQLSTDASTWQYWNGSAWTSAGATNYNTANVVNTNIGSFSTTSEQIVFKAFLISDGSQFVQLDEVSIGCGKYYNWPFTTPTNYTYDINNIEVTGGIAQLDGSIGSCSGIATACSTYGDNGSCDGQDGCSWSSGSLEISANSNFTSNADAWKSGTWNVGGGEVTPTVPWQSSGGNPNGYVEIDIPFNAKDDELGAYWEQAINITDNGATVSCNFDWSLIQWVANDGVDDYQFYVFLDSSSGEPTIGSAGQVWVSGSQSGTTAWASQSIDCSALAATSGTYYFKLAVWLDTKKKKNTGPITAGYDNAFVSWTGTSFCSGTATDCSTYGDSGTCSGQDGCSWSGGVYPTNEPPINPIAVYSASGVDTWTSFSEIATKDGGEVYYQLSTDASTWQYWNGSAWTSAGATNYNTANVVNTNIGSFSTTSEQIVFKAFLISDGSQFVQLDNVQIAWGEGNGGISGYETSGYLISSAYDLSDDSPVQIIEWDEILVLGSDIKFQVRTASDSGGLPGTWTNWYGIGGSGTYFTEFQGDLISVDLNQNQWAQYRVELSGDGTDTPILEEIRVNYK
jgi:hypothetical protein